MEKGFFQPKAFFLRQAASQTLQITEIVGLVDVVGLGGNGHIDAPNAFACYGVSCEVPCHGEGCRALCFQHSFELITHVAVDVDAPGNLFVADFGGGAEREDAEIVLFPAENTDGFANRDHDGVDGVESSVEELFALRAGVFSEVVWGGGGCECNFDDGDFVVEAVFFVVCCFVDGGFSGEAVPRGDDESFRRVTEKFISDGGLELEGELVDGVDGFGG